MINALRSELLKMRTMPGVWVTFGLAFPLTVLGILIVFAAAGGFAGHTFYFVTSLSQRRRLLGAGFFGIEILHQIHRSLDVGKQRGDGLALAVRKRPSIRLLWCDANLSFSQRRRECFGRRPWRVSGERSAAITAESFVGRIFRTAFLTSIR